MVPPFVFARLGGQSRRSLLSRGMPSQGIDNRLGFLRYWKRGLRQVTEYVTDKQTEFGRVAALRQKSKCTYLAEAIFI